MSYSSQEFKESKGRECPSRCGRFLVHGYCTHTLAAHQEQFRTARRREKDQKRLQQAAFGELEVPKWRITLWSQWRKEVSRKSGIYVILNDKDVVLCAGDGTELWRRLFSWEMLIVRESLLHNARVVWWLETVLTKELVAATRRALGWNERQLRSPMIGAKWDADIAERVRREHPMYDLEVLEAAKEDPREFWL